jgi:predicted PurR-regulated permease PerM
MQEDNKRYYKWGLTVFLTLVAVIVVLIVLTNFAGVAAVASDLLYILRPLLYGFVFAYLLNPIVEAVERRLCPLLKRRGVSDRRTEIIGRAAGIAAALLLVILLVYALVSMILPQLVESITGIISSMPGYYETVQNWVLDILEDEPVLKGYADTLLERFYTWLENWVAQELPGTLQTVMITITSSVVSVIKGLLNVIIGLIISIYIMVSRDKFLAQSKKLVIAAFRPERADRLMELGRRCNRIFGGFISGKLLDSLIIGVLCFIGMSLLRLPYPMLIATIVGVTNVIPFFGPYIGAIPSAILILLVSPLQCFYFVVFILILQQLDGNVIGPHILGDATGLSGFWVVVAITVASGLFGFAGMLLGVPVFAFLYTLLSDWVNRRLQEKERPTQTTHYYGLKTVSDLEEEEPESADV